MMATFKLGFEGRERRPLSGVRDWREGGTQRRVWVTCWGVLCGGRVAGRAQPQVEALWGCRGRQRGPSGGRVPSPSSTAPRPEPGHLSEAGQVRAAFLPCGLAFPAYGLRIVASPDSSFLGIVRIPCMENTGKDLLSSWPRWGKGDIGTSRGWGLLRVQRSAGSGTVSVCGCPRPTLGSFGPFSCSPASEG